MASAQDYRHIRAWGKYLGSFDYYIKDQQERAALANAPLDALYRKGDGWFTFSELTSPDSKEAVEKLLAS